MAKGKYKIRKYYRNRWRYKNAVNYGQNGLKAKVEWNGLLAFKTDAGGITIYDTAGTEKGQSLAFAVLMAQTARWTALRDVFSQYRITGVAIETNIANLPIASNSSLYSVAVGIVNDTLGNEGEYDYNKLCSLDQSVLLNLHGKSRIYKKVYTNWQQCNGSNISPFGSVIVRNYIDQSVGPSWAFRISLYIEFRQPKV